MKITKKRLEQLIREELNMTEEWVKDISSDAFHHRQGKGGPPDPLDKFVDDSRSRARGFHADENRRAKIKLINQLVGHSTGSDLDRAEALRDLADELEDQHYDAAADLGV